MYIYFLFYIFVFLIYFILNGTKVRDTEISNQINNIQNNKFLKRVFVCIVFSTLVLVLGLRNSDMGVDLDGYINSFYEINNNTLINVLKLKKYLNYEKGYVIYNKLIGIIYLNENFFLFVTALISTLPIAYIIGKYSKDVLLSIIVYVGSTPFLMCFSGLRQGIALGMVFFSYKFIKEKKIIKFLILIWFASLFHSSALIFMIAYPLYHIKLTRNTAIVASLLIPIFYIFRNQIVNLGIKLIGRNDESTETNAFTLAIVFSLIYFYCLIFGDREKSEENGLSNLFIVACLFQVLGSVHNLVGRYGLYYAMMLLVLLPETNENIFNSSRKEWDVLRAVVITCFVAYGLYALKNGGWAETYPYSFFWENAYYLG